MGRLKTFTRRGFLIGSSAIAGGVAFGIYQVRKPHANPLLASAADGDAVFNPWVLINADGITLITPHVELGQGAQTAQALLIAEELDLQMDQFRVSFGTPSPAYYNTALGSESVPVMTTDQSFKADTLRAVSGAAFKLLGVQVTGGSSTVPDSFDKLRRAGAVARETLKLAAAQQTGLPVDALRTERGAVLLPSGERLDYTALAETAAGIEPVDHVTLREPSEWRLIGTPQRRTDIIAKSTGTQDFGIDVSIDGMRYASARVNPRQGGALRGFDASKAEAMRGVEKVIPLKNGAAVIASNTWYAIRAVNAIDFDWGPAPYPAEQDAHWQAVQDAFVEERLDKEWRHDGDVESALAAGDAIDAEYRAPYLAHAPLEPLNAIVRVGKTHSDIWVGHQMPRFVQEKVAAVTGQSPDDIRVHNQFAGGSFGHRLEFLNVTLAAEIANQMPGETIKLTFSREEDMAHDYPRQIGMGRGRGTVKDGRIESCSIDIATVSSSTSQAGRLGQSVPGPDNQIPAAAWDLPYAIEHFRVRGYRVPELAPTSSWRSVGASTGAFFADCFIDELIHAAGADPLRERLRMAGNDPIARQVLEAVAEMSDWDRPLGGNRGRGVAFAYSFGVPCAEVVEVTQTERGIVIDKVFVAADVGRVVDPVNFDNQVKGAVVWGLGHAMNAEITYRDGMAEQKNYHQFQGMRFSQSPVIEVRGLENAKQIRGIGEPPVPPAAPALANAIFAATGQRIREMPLNKHIQFA